MWPPSKVREKINSHSPIALPTQREIDTDMVSERKKEKKKEKNNTAKSFLET